MSERYQLHQGDCLELLRSIPDNSIDMVLCDLPYGVTRNEWDKPIDLEVLWTQYKRVVRSGGVMAMFGKQRFAIELAASNLKAFRYKIVWQKTLGTDFLNAKRKPLSCHEDVLIFYDKQPIYNPQKRTGFKPYIKDQFMKSKRCSSNLGDFEPRRYQENKDGSVSTDAQTLYFKLLDASVLVSGAANRPPKPLQEKFKWQHKCAVAQFSRRVAGANSYGFTEDMFVLKVRALLEEQLTNLKSSKLNKRRNAITSVQKILCKILADYELDENAAAFN